MPGFRRGGVAPGTIPPMGGLGGGYMDPIAPRGMSQPNIGPPPMMNRGGPPPELGGNMMQSRPMGPIGQNPNGFKSFKPMNMGGGNVPITDATQRKFGLGNYANQGQGLPFTTTTNNPILSHFKKFNQPGSAWRNFGQNRGAEVANRGGGSKPSFRPKRPVMGMF